MVTAGVRLPYACVRIRLSTEHPLLSHLGWPAGTDCLCCVGDDVSVMMCQPLLHLCSMAMVPGSRWSRKAPLNQLMCIASSWT